MVEEAAASMTAEKVGRRVAECVRCKRQCPLHSRHTPGRLRMSIAGITCTDFSALNARKLGNAGKSGHVLLAYIADLRARKFDIVITECVPGSNASVFQQLLGSLYDVRSIVVCLS